MDSTPTSDLGQNDPSSAHLPVLRPWSLSQGLLSWLRQSGLIRLLAIGALALGLWGLYSRTTSPVMFVVDGHPVSYRTHQSSVGAFLQEIGLSTRPEDLIIPPPDSAVEAGDTVTIVRARPFAIEADGKLLQLYSHAERPQDLLHEAGVRLGESDLILVDRDLTAPDTPFPASSEEGEGQFPPFRLPLVGGRLPARYEAIRVTVRRAVPIQIHDDSLEGSLYSTAATVGEALLKQGITLYLGDKVNPSLGTPLSTGMHVYIKRSVPVEILVDGRRIRTRTLAENVGDLLSQEGVALMGKDVVAPGEDSPVVENMAVKVTRVVEQISFEEESLPYETIWKPNAELEIDHQQVQQPGAPGLLKRRIRTRYEDGQEVSRWQEDEWVEREPQTKILNYGTKIVVRELETPNGTIKYWRHLRVLATSYTAATSGKSRDHPQFGITFLGWPMRTGIVAVDPNVINLRSEMYVPGYGVGVAGDTGGAIKGRRIDLGYAEHELVMWYRWVDIYLLAPAPPASQISWVLPDWPRER